MVVQAELDTVGKFARHMAAVADRLGYAKLAAAFNGATATSASTAQALLSIPRPRERFARDVSEATVRSFLGVAVRGIPLPVEAIDTSREDYPPIRLYINTDTISRLSQWLADEEKKTQRGASADGPGGGFGGC